MLHWTPQHLQALTRCAGALLVAVTSAGCPTNTLSTGNAGNAQSLDVGIIEDSSSDLAAIVVAQGSKEAVLVLGDKGTAGSLQRLTGGGFIDRNGSSIVFWFNREGLPSRAVLDDLTIFFQNYTTNSVDLAAVRPNGTVTRATGVSLDASLLSDLRGFAAQGATFKHFTARGIGCEAGKITGQQWSRVVKWTTFGAKAACCAISGGATLLGLAPAGYAVPFCCGGVLQTIVVDTVFTPQPIDPIEFYSQHPEYLESQIKLSIVDAESTAEQAEPFAESDAESDGTPFIYWSEVVAEKLRRARVDGSDLSDLVQGTLSANFVALDPVRNELYWTEADGNRIRRANLDGSGVETIGDGLSSPGAIAVDSTNSKLYWAEGGRIRRADLNGAQREDVIFVSEGFLFQPFPVDFALDIPGNRIYWTETGDTSEGRIRRATLDGSGTTTLIDLSGEAGSPNPQAIAIDVPSGKVYWSEDDTDRIMRANLDGSQREVLVTSSCTPFDLVLDLEGGKMIWTELFCPTNRIRTANLNGSGVENILTGLRGPTGIALLIPS